MAAIAGAPYAGGKVRPRRLIPLFRYYAKDGKPLVKGLSVVQIEQWRHVPNGGLLLLRLKNEFAQRPDLFPQLNRPARSRARR
jgi:hypothetical protein